MIFVKVIPYPLVLYIYTHKTEGYLQGNYLYPGCYPLLCSHERDGQGSLGDAPLAGRVFAGVRFFRFYLSLHALSADQFGGQ